MGSERGFKLRVTMKDVIAAALPMQEHWLPLTNLDLLLPAVDVSVALCYKGNNAFGSSFKQKVSVIRRALAEALGTFYGFSGQLVTNSAGEPELLCNNRGVDFIEAFADVKLSDLNFYNADQSLGKFMPVKKEGVLSVQVTELKCGAIMVGCTFDHRVADACSANMFLILWSEMATYKPISVYPCFRRSLLSHRHPAKYDPSLDDMYLQLSSLKLSPSHHRQQKTIKSETVVSRIYHVSVDELCRLQLLTSKNGCYKRTKLQSFCAFLWKMVASHASQSGDQNSSKLCSMGIVVDGRTRLSNGENEHKKETLASYFGNVLSIPYGQQQIADLKDQPLSWVADRVLNFLEPALKKDHFMDLIDWVEAHKPGPALAKIYSVGNESGPAFVVSSGLRFPISQVDFGWGKPIFGSYHFPWKGNCGYVMAMPSPKGNGDWVVYMQLQQSQLYFIEANAPTLFKPFSMNLVCSDH